MAKVAQSDSTGILYKDALAQPEFATVRTTSANFGLSRTVLYRLMLEGQISWVHFKQAGARKGIRLINLQSLRNHLQTMATEK